MNITGGKYKGQKIKAPDENITRPTLSKVRMSVFNTLQAMMDFEGASFLDMFAGSGIMGLEAISRGFSRSVAIEKNRKIFNVIKLNFSKYEKENDIRVVSGDSLKVAKMLGQFDVVYIDPPYFQGVYEQALDAVSQFVDSIIILEHVVDVNFDGFEIIKQKKYGDKFITFLAKAKLK
ncbi:MAG: 16S rRNA (guanine(966)-N(2))-methyltransferase RsmD [Cyanobacteria bacterium SIG26]|nr:16S rRNA (guanine(966)-N(2))-methyltransferase RsmD [Cyanobacteria bacterium SIG26]